MELLLEICLTVIITCAIISGILTVMAVISLLNKDGRTPEAIERSKTGFYIYSAIGFANVVLAFVLTLPEEGLQFDYPKLLIAGVTLEALFFVYICRVVLQSVDEHFEKN